MAAKAIAGYRYEIIPCQIGVTHPHCLLSEKETDALAAQAVTVVAGTRNPDIVLLCEHGGSAVPATWQDLGLPRLLFETHLGCDLGAAELTRAVGAEIGATTIIAHYSRLFLDYNRKLSDPDCLRIEIGGIPIPGNLELTEKEIELRELIARAPVERAMAQWTEQRSAKAVISIHSFSPYWNNAKRDCEIGVMWREDARLAPRLIEALSKKTKYVVRSNEPYDFRASDGFTLQRHGLEIGLPCAYRVRNDLICAGGSIERCLAEAILNALHTSQKLT
jgi:predicted N-formylglutamate amidohydrolase